MRVGLGGRGGGVLLYTGSGTILCGGGKGFGVKVTHAGSDSDHSRPRAHPHLNVVISGQLFKVTPSQDARSPEPDELAGSLALSPPSSHEASVPVAKHGEYFYYVEPGRFA